MSRIDRRLHAPDKVRRALLATAAGMTGALIGCGGVPQVRNRSDTEPQAGAADLGPGEKPEEGEEGVSPAEDLMREHGVLNRILLLYEEGIRRIETSPRELPPSVVSSAADIVRRFVEDYHEMLEETHLFPRFEKAGLLTDLVATLRTQHQSGRRLTDEIRRLATDKALAQPAGQQALVRVLRQFICMYRPHEAREDTVLFPALRRIVSAHEYGSLGEQFERQEHQLFGEDGFGLIVQQVADLERQLGIYDLTQFTA